MRGRLKSDLQLNHFMRHSSICFYYVGKNGFLKPFKLGRSVRSGITNIAYEANLFLRNATSNELLGEHFFVNSKNRTTKKV